MQMIMQPNIVAQPRKGVYAMSWAPGVRTLARPRRSLGQTKFFESPLLALMTDAVAAGASAYLAWGLGHYGNKWATFFWVVAAASAVKGLHDMSRLKE
jgi:hypothetical protein